MGVNSLGSVFPMTQIVCISNFRSLSLIVNILWLFEKNTLMNVTTLYLSFFRFVTSQTVQSHFSKVVI